MNAVSTMVENDCGEEQKLFPAIVFRSILMLIAAWLSPG